MKVDKVADMVADNKKIDVDMEMLHVLHDFEVRKFVPPSSTSRRSRRRTFVGGKFLVEILQGGNFGGNCQLNKCEY